MEYYYIATSTLNLNNILTTESISPEAFYKIRKFGYKRFNKVSPNPFSNSIIAYSKVPIFNVDESDFDDYPMILGVSRELLDDNVISQNIEVEGINILQINSTVYLHPSQSRFLFKSNKDLKTCLIKVEPSIETKLLPLYYANFQLVEKVNDSFLWKDVYLSKIKDIPSNGQLINIENDSKINRLKGFYYSYFLGIILTSTTQQPSLKDEFISGLNSIINSLSSTKTTHEHKTFNNLLSIKSRVDESDGIKIIPTEELIDSLYLEESGVRDRDKLINFLKKTKAGKFTFYSQLEWSVEQNSSTNHINLLIDNLIEAIKAGYPKELISRKSSRIIKYISGLQYKVKNPVNPLFLVNSISFNAFKVTSLADEIFKKRGAELYQNIINEIIDYPIYDIQDFLEERIELTLKIGEVLKDFIDNWDDSNERHYLNGLMDNIENYAPFEIKSHNSLVLQSLAIFILKGDDPEKLLSALLQNKIDDYRLALGFWGAIFGFSALPKTITNQLFVPENLEVANAFYQDTQKKIHNNLSKDEISIHSVPQYVVAVKQPEKSNTTNLEKKPKKQYIENDVKPTIINEECPKCPKCGADTILKEGMYGKFYGCTRYSIDGCDGRVNIKDIPVTKEAGKDLYRIIIDYLSKNKRCKISDLIPIIKEKTNVSRNVGNIEAYIRDYMSAELKLERIDRASGVKIRDKEIFD